MWGSCFWFCILLLPAPPPPHASTCHTHHRLSHTTLSHTLFHRPSFTHNFVTQSHTIFHTPPLSHNFVVAWHLATSTFVWHGRRGTYGTGLALVARLVPVGRPGRRGTLRGSRGTWRHLSSFCVAGVALGDIHLRFAWQAWHLETSTLILRDTNFHTNLFHTHLSKHKLEHTVLYTQLCHSHLFHELEHTNFHTHTQRFHTQTHKLPHKTLPRTTFHTQFFHTQVVTHNSFTHCLAHTTLSHTTLSHTQPVTHSTFTHNSFTHSSITHTVLSHNLSSPSYFHTCLELAGRSWHVGLSGPLIFLTVQPPVIVVASSWWFCYLYCCWSGGAMGKSYSEDQQAQGPCLMEASRPLAALCASGWLRNHKPSSGTKALVAPLSDWRGINLQSHSHHPVVRLSCEHITWPQRQAARRNAQAGRTGRPRIPLTRSQPYGRVNGYFAFVSPPVKCWLGLASIDANPPKDRS